MPDMLVKLYTLPPLEPEIAAQAANGVTIRRGLPPEKHVVLDWVARNFERGWMSECDVGFSRQPVSVWLALASETLVGFACYDTTGRGFFGPTGVSESMRGKGVGKGLLLACLHAMYDLGYGYAIIGAAGPVEYYRKTVGAQVIEDSWPGFYSGLLTTAPD
ncbi:MAG: GNAT family N-acetyltransferase [Anaerolineae bacterium]|nr:GNAT family N-acetyltransferase [Anaerolineae bacterium]